MKDSIFLPALPNTPQAMSDGEVDKLSVLALAHVGDGVFELLLIRAPKDLLELSDCIKSLQKQTYDCNMITFLSTPSLAVTAPGDMPWTLDGEREDPHETVQVENLHHAIRVIRRSKL